MAQSAAADVEHEQEHVGAHDRGDGQLVAKKSDEQAIDQSVSKRRQRRRGDHFNRMMTVCGDEVQMFGGVMDLVEFPKLRDRMEQIMRQPLQAIIDNEQGQRQRNAKANRGAVRHRARYANGMQRRNGPRRNRLSN